MTEYDFVYSGLYVIFVPKKFLKKCSITKLVCYYEQKDKVNINEEKNNPLLYGLK